MVLFGSGKMALFSKGHVQNDAFEIDWPIISLVARLCTLNPRDSKKIRRILDSTVNSLDLQL